MEQDLKLRKKQLANLQLRKDYKRPPDIYKYKSIIEESNGDMTT
jgi:hypothetical protein